MIETIVTVIHVIVALFMIIVVLVQGGNSGGIGAAFGGGNSQGVLGASGGQSLLGKITYIMAAIFMVTSISLTAMQGDGDIGLGDKLESGLQKQMKKDDAAVKKADPKKKVDTIKPVKKAEPKAKK